MGYSAHRLLSLSRDEAERELRRALAEHIRAKIVDDLPAEMLKQDLTISLSELTQRWKDLSSGLSTSNDILGGNTPMRATFEAINERFERERLVHPNASCTLFVVSDGESTDGDPQPPARMMAEAGVKIVSCFVSAQNVVDLGCYMQNAIVLGRMVPVRCLI
jgi:von Willebrand factor type A domain